MKKERSWKCNKNKIFPHGETRRKSFHFQFLSARARDGTATAERMAFHSRRAVILGGVYGVLFKNSALLMLGKGSISSSNWKANTNN